MCYASPLLQCPDTAATQLGLRDFSIWTLLRVLHAGGAQVLAALGGGGTGAGEDSVGAGAGVGSEVGLRQEQGGEPASPLPAFSSAASAPTACASSSCAWKVLVEAEVLLSELEAPGHHHHRPLHLPTDQPTHTGAPTASTAEATTAATASGPGAVATAVAQLRLLPIIPTLSGQPRPASSGLFLPPQGCASGTAGGGGALLNPASAAATATAGVLRLEEPADGILGRACACYCHTFNHCYSPL